MKKLNRLSALILILFSFNALALPLNSESVKTEDQKVNYHDSGKYYQDLENATKPAMDFLKYKVAMKKPGEKLAIVFDIDDTVLSNYPNMHKMHFTNNKEAIAVAYMKGLDVAITPTQNLYNYAKANNVSIFFVTGRPELPEVHDATVKNLSAAGFSGWKKIFFRPLTDNHPSVVGYKSGIRESLTKKGYDIILNVGDQASDLAGGFAQKAIKLPNPFYTLS